MRSPVLGLLLAAGCLLQKGLPAGATPPAAEPSCPATGTTVATDARRLGIMSELEGEGREEASNRVHLVQVKAAAAKARSSQAPPAHEADKDAQPDLQGALTGSGGVVSLDHNGRMCMMCGRPLPERVGNKSFLAFRRDCGNRSTPSGPELSALSLPAATLSPPSRAAPGLPTNGFCEMNYAKSCADAIANEDYLYWAKSLDFAHPDMQKTAGWDGRYCHISGFLEPDIVALQHNFSGLQAKARELCSTKYAQHGVETLSFLDMMSKARYEEGAPNVAEADLRAAWSCAMGDLGCDLAMCAYSFCTKKGTEGSTGLYSDCPGWDPEQGMPLAHAL